MSEALTSEIEHLRKRMVEVALEHGFASEESVELSQKLDTLLNQMQIKQSS
ncbi:aspartyl-phosphate phosphatase Spo0E family protein [Halobacillus locisalis]|uniref:Aspartyl-phosphate phosphatase Spo0E family protein n=1 Tax=Halobacillus locisalis TaxID=220753 RepID=A0A838CRX8_9BACI|nr:aspartyl-phosphate phosphatase Spo0E family protein [Halobacillus locisalis]MBA2174366.1 aspartyl-phosphate phosphatase Spo0E family protein [Halobacillus locisalis]